jgi:hypothetical protein
MRFQMRDAFQSTAFSVTTSLGWGARSLISSKEAATFCDISFMFRYEKMSTSSCSAQGGMCMSARAGGCAGTFQRGLCSGGADIQCCMPAIPIPREPAACAMNGVRGTCLDARTDACSGAFVRGRCAGPKHVQCCLPPVGAAPPVVPAPTGGGTTMLLMGDSLSVGMTAPFQRLARAAGYTPVAATKSGTTISYWRPRVAEALAAAGGRPATVLVSLGTNDSVMAKPTQQRDSLAALIQASVATGAAQAHTPLRHPTASRRL